MCASGPTGIPRAKRSSSESSPGFFSVRRVSNSYKITKQKKAKTDGEKKRQKPVASSRLRPNLALVVKVAMNRHLGLGLPAEEGIMKFLIVDINFAHLWSRLERGDSQ